MISSIEPLYCKKCGDKLGKELYPGKAQFNSFTGASESEPNIKAKICPKRYNKKDPYYWEHNEWRWIEDNNVWQLYIFMRLFDLDGNSRSKHLGLFEKGFTNNWAFYFHVSKILSSYVFHVDIGPIHFLISSDLKRFQLVTPWSAKVKY